MSKSITFISALDVLAPLIKCTLPFKKGTVKCLNGAAGHLKRCAVAAARAAPRADGLTPQKLSALFRFRVRCQLQAAIMRGNGLIAAEVGL